jgi:hypothetical protein
VLPLGNEIHYVVGDGGCANAGIAATMLKAPGRANRRATAACDVVSLLYIARNWTRTQARFQTAGSIPNHMPTIVGVEIILH